MIAQYDCSRTEKYRVCILNQISVSDTVASNFISNCISWLTYMRFKKPFEKLYYCDSIPTTLQNHIADFTDSINRSSTIAFDVECLKTLYQQEMCRYSPDDDVLITANRLNHINCTSVELNYSQ